jgi:hypothetical protein
VLVLDLERVPEGDEDSVGDNVTVTDIEDESVALRAGDSEFVADLLIFVQLPLSVPDKENVVEGASVSDPDTETDDDAVGV